jgi:pimeloyl-ACP methyl ester carboxylesterase
MPESDVLRHAARLGQESQRITLDELGLNLPRPKRVTTPLLVLGVERSFTSEEVHATSRAFHTTAEIFPRMGHNMMLEPGWQAVAERIDGWLAAHGLSEQDSCGPREAADN